jgi:hypothetical protein
VSSHNDDNRLFYLILTLRVRDRSQIVCILTQTCNLNEDPMSGTCKPCKRDRNLAWFLLISPSIICSANTLSEGRVRGTSEIWQMHLRSSEQKIASSLLSYQARYPAFCPANQNLLRYRFIQACLVCEHALHACMQDTNMKDSVCWQLHLSLNNPCQHHHQLQLPSREPQCLSQKYALFAKETSFSGLIDSKNPVIGSDR